NAPAPPASATPAAAPTNHALQPLNRIRIATLPRRGPSYNENGDAGRAVLSVTSRLSGGSRPLGPRRWTPSAHTARSFPGRLPVSVHGQPDVARLRRLFRQRLAQVVSAAQERHHERLLRLRQP